MVACYKEVQRDAKEEVGGMNEEKVEEDAGHVWGMRQSPLPWIYR